MTNYRIERDLVPYPLAIENRDKLQPMIVKLTGNTDIPLIVNEFSKPTLSYGAAMGQL